MNGKSRTKKVNKEGNNDTAEMTSNGKHPMSLGRKFFLRLKKKAPVEADVIIDIESTNSISGDSTTEGDSTADSIVEDNDGNGIDIVPEESTVTESDIELTNLTKKLANQPKLINLDEAYYVEQHLSKEDVPVAINGANIEIEFKENDAQEYAVNFLHRGNPSSSCSLSR